MKKKRIIFAAALCLALSACAGQSVQESAPATAVPTAAQTVKPTAAPTPVVVTMEPLAGHTTEPVSTPAPTPALTPTPTAAPTAQVSISPSVEPTAPAAVTPAPEVTPPPTENAHQSPMPTESLCSLPLAPTPTRSGSVPPAATESPAPGNSPEPTAAPSQSPEPTHPTDEEVLAAYRAAKEAMGWMTDSYDVEGYDDSGLALDSTDQQTLTLTLGNGAEETLVFDRITRPGLDSMESLWGYLKSLFSDEIVDDLMAFQVPVFVEGEQGGLYALPSQAQGFQRPGSTLTILWPDEEAPVSCQIRAFTGGGEEYRESLYQKVGDKWIFTQFEVPNSDKK